MCSNPNTRVKIFFFLHRPFIFLPIGSHGPSPVAHFNCLCTNLLSPSAFSSASSVTCGRDVPGAARFRTPVGGTAPNDSGFLFSTFLSSGRARAAQTHTAKIHVICKTKKTTPCQRNENFFVFFFFLDAIISLNYTGCDNYKLFIDKERTSMYMTLFV